MKTLPSSFLFFARHAQNRENLTPLSPKFSHWLNHSPLVRAETPQILKKPKFFASKSAEVRIWWHSLPTSLSALDNPLSPLTADVFKGQPLVKILKREKVEKQSRPLKLVWMSRLPRSVSDNRHVTKWLERPHRRR